MSNKNGKSLIRKDNSPSVHQIDLLNNALQCLTEEEQKEIAKTVIQDRIKNQLDSEGRMLKSNEAIDNINNGITAFNQGMIDDRSGKLGTAKIKEKTGTGGTIEINITKGRTGCLGSLLIVFAVSFLLIYFI